MVVATPRTRVSGTPGDDGVDGLRAPWDAHAMLDPLNELGGCERRLPG
jgi:hypothetical protein